MNIEVCPINEIKSLSNILNRKLFDVLSAVGDEKLNSVQLWILCFIYYRKQSEKEVFQKDIELYFDIRRPTASKMLGALEDQCFLERFVDDDDNRRKKLVLTEKAVQCVESRTDYIKQFNEQFLYGVSKRELISFLRTLDNMKRNLDRIRTSGRKALR
ncbi:MAG: MarR family winged helix-turn-helix transcriptional regulator [Sphaerochaetaceae bacterium]|jgi:DNA-binding MarR family transcriptional regulator|nr:MarR family winged helix-turn-helix transcriptional regulator [Sphaerochaetaceae bacterium]